MTEAKSPRGWAYELTQVLNAVFGPERFPVDVAALARDYTAQLYPDDPVSVVKGDDLPGFDGALYPDPHGRKGWAIIYNNRMASKGRINFTLAHEFGHYLLHRHLEPQGIECGQQDVVRWDSGYRQIEHQANVFAANLLMPLDDFRLLINPRDRIDLDAVSGCAERYRVSLIAAILRWLEYTEKRAVLVVSRDDYILWSRASDPAWKTGAFFRTSGRPVHIPSGSLAAQEDRGAEGRDGIELPPGVWFSNEEAREMVVFSEQYEFVISLLLLQDHPPFYMVEEEPIKDAFDHLTGRL